MMRKSLSLIATVLAFAVIGSAVFAYAPVIKPLPDVYIGDMEDNVGTADLNLFRFSDAFDLDTYVEDGDTTIGELAWSFDGLAPIDLEINGLTQLADPSDAANAAALGKDIRHPADAQFQPGNLVDFLITDSDPASFNEVVTFFVSDGLFVDSEQILVVANDGGYDYISASDPWALERSDDFEGTNDGWGFIGLSGTTAPDFFAPAGSSYDGSKLGVTGFDTGTNRFSFWFGPTVSYQASKLYKFAWSVSTSQANQDNVPTVRLRVNAASFANTMALGSDGVTNPNAPTATAKTYNQYVMPVAAEDLRPSFDVYDFNTADAGNVYLEQLDVYTADVPATGWTADAVPAFSS